MVIASSRANTRGNGAIGFRRAWMSRRRNSNEAGYVNPRKGKDPSAASAGCDAYTDRTPQNADRSPFACIDRTRQQLATQKLLFLNDWRRCVTSPDRAVQRRRQRSKRFRSVTRGSPDSQTLLQQPRQAPPVGRALRILLGLVLMVYVTPVYSKVPGRVAVGSLLLMLSSFGFYSLIHIVLSPLLVAFSSFLGVIVQHWLLVPLYVAAL